MAIDLVSLTQPKTTQQVLSGMGIPAGKVQGANTVAQPGPVGAIGTGGGSGGYRAPAPVDPYNVQQHSFLDSIPGAIGSIGANANDAFDSGQRNLQGSAENLFNTVKTGQKAINTSRENVELNRLSAVGDILGFVRNGLHSGATQLANMNAGESSAAGEIGKTYGNIGNSRMRAVGNDAFLKNRDINTQQDQLELQKNQGNTDFHRQRDDMVSTIGQQVRSQLASLDAQGQGVGLAGKVAIDAEKQKVIDAGMAKLNGVDSWLQSQLGTIAPQDDATTRTNAIALQQGGQGNVTPFDFGGDPTQTVQGPAIDQLPLMVRSKKTSG